MNVLISGTAGVAVGQRGEQLFLLTPELEEPEEISSSALSRILGDARDVRAYENVGWRRARTELLTAIQVEKGLQLLPVLLDADLTEKTRSSAAEEFAELLSDQRARRRLERLVVSRPVPAGADWSKAFRFGTRAGRSTREWLFFLRSVQPAVADVYAAYEATAHEHTKWSRARLAETGIFLRLVQERFQATRPRSNWVFNAGLMSLGTAPPLVRDLQRKVNLMPLDPLSRQLQHLRRRQELKNRYRLRKARARIEQTADMYRIRERARAASLIRKQLKLNGHS